MHQSNALVEFSQNMLFLKMFAVISVHKIPKTVLKYILFKDVSKNHVLGLKLVKSDRF
jgi:hypothetical protein